MNFKKTLLAVAATATLMAGGASAASAYPDRDHDRRPDNGWAERHDRDGFNDNRHYDRRVNREERRFINHDRVFEVVRAHHYRYIGNPYWYRGVYGVRAYDPYGRIVFVNVDPYSGAWGGISFRF